MSTIILTMSQLFKEKYPNFKDLILIPIPRYKKKQNFETYQQIRILPRKRYYEVEIIYKKDINQAVLKQDSYLSVDFGLNNLTILV